VKPPDTRRSGKEESLRARKKIQMHQRIADAAATLFATNGYDAVTLVEIARQAEVSEQTVYNFFPTKEMLVLDEDAAFEARLVGMIRGRPTGTRIADAVRVEAHAFLKHLQVRPKGPKSRGGLPYLINTSPLLRRAWLAALERYAGAIAKVLAEESAGAISPLASHALGCFIVRIFSLIIDEIGRATIKGTNMGTLIKKLHVQVDDAVDRITPALDSIG
jgi:AcrR family transcriptional regulator